MTAITVMQRVGGYELIFVDGRVVGNLEFDGIEYEPYDVINTKNDILEEEIDA